MISPEQRSEIVACAVADGHGGARYVRSDTGSNFAVQVTQKALEALIGSVGKEGLRSPNVQQRIASTVPEQIVEDWKANVDRHRTDHPLTPEEAAIWARETGAPWAEYAAPALCYGATLLVVLAVRDELMFMQLGDGDILLVSDTGETVPAFATDPRHLGGQTTSLCTPDALAQVRIGFWNRPETLPSLVMVSTDGYSNSYPDEPSFHKVASDIWEMAAEGNWEKVKPTLPTWLTETTRKGSGDDITVALIARG